MGDNKINKDIFYQYQAGAGIDITEKMYENYNEIVKKDINVFLKRPDIKSLLELDSDEEIKIVEED